MGPDTGRSFQQPKALPDRGVQGMSMWSPGGHHERQHRWRWTGCQTGPWAKGLPGSSDL